MAADDRGAFHRMSDSKKEIFLVKEERVTDPSTMTHDRFRGPVHEAKNIIFRPLTRFKTSVKITYNTPSFLPSKRLDFHSNISEHLQLHSLCRRLHQS